MAEARDDLDFEVKQRVFESWTSLLNLQMKEIKEGRTKLNSRRVFYDHLRQGLKKDSKSHEFKIICLKLNVINVNVSQALP